MRHKVKFLLLVAGKIAALVVAAVGAAPSEAADGLDFSPAADVLKRGIAERVFPGCAVAVGNSRKSLWREGFGFLDYETHEPVTQATIYDLASLTKVIGTATVVMRLIDDGRLRLDEPVARRLPEFLDGFDEAQRGRRQASVEHLLTHSAGLTAWQPFYKTVGSYDALVAAAAAAPLENDPGEVYRYSDLGFILLGELAARAGGKPLAELEQELVFRPLAMPNTLRNPPPELRERIAPAEEIEPGRGEFFRGVVHDENCRAAGGVTGHAGLFSTATDLARFAEHLLRILRGETGLVSQDRLKQFTRRQHLIEGSSRALGWDTPSGDSSAGDLFSRRSFGHTGFTGTSIWIDPDRDLYVILLTNRVHPTRENSRIHPVRRRLADAVARVVDAARDRKW